MSLKEYWFPWYPGRFKADTMHLTALQDGIYRRLIDHYMETKMGLPDNDNALARIAGVSVSEFVDNSGIIRGFFEVKTEGRLSHKKCDAILKQQEKISKSYSKRGKLGGKAKAKKTKENQELSKEEITTAKQQPEQGLAHNTLSHNITEQESLSLRGQQRGGSFSIDYFLRDEDRAAVREAAPGFDLYNLCSEFDERVNSGAFERPQKPARAFIAWAKSFTKGKKP